MSTLDELELLNQELLRRTLLASFPAFVEHFWVEVEPKTPLSWNWHLDELCDLVQHSQRRPSDNRIVNIPPGSMKSLLMSVMARAWLWARDPSLRFLTASYSGHLSVRDNVRVRQLVESERFQSMFPNVQLTDDQNQKTKFSTTVGGWSIATSVGGAGTGEHPDYIIIDDPLSALQAESAADRATANNWLDGTISTRGVTRGVRVWVVMQRLNENDCTQHLLNRGGYTKTCFPMRFEKENADPRDHRTKDGELLWPDLFDEKKVRKLEIALGEYGTAGQLQQRPAPAGGGLFKRIWFENSYVDKIPNSIRRRCRGWDTAATQDGGDWTVGVRMSEGADGYFYIEHVVREQLGPAGVESLILSTAMMDGTATAIREEQEGGSAGKSVIFSRARLLKGYAYSHVSLTRNKVLRAQAFRAQCEAGNVRILRGEWTEQFLDELCAFPTGLHDDQVDASSAAFNALLELPIVENLPTGIGQDESYWTSMDKSDGDVDA